MLLTGAGTLWSNQNDLVVGNASFGNQLVVSNGAMIVSSNVFVGFGATSTNNRVVVDGGVLLLTNAVGNGTLDVRRGTNVINAGLVEVDQLLVTNTSGRFEFNGGTLAVNQSTINNGQLFRVGNGVSAASFDLVGIGTHTFVSGLTISANVTINTEIGKNGSVVTNNQIIVSGTLTYGGTLIVSNLGPTTLVGGDRFKLFDATSTSIAGSFSSITLPPLDPLFVWTNKLLVDGSIEVTLAPGLTYLKASNTGTNDGFGSSVAVSGDTLVVGAKTEDSNATGVNGNQTNHAAGLSGAAYVFARNGDSWVQQAYLKASNTGAGDFFGGEVAISGDTIVVGAEREASNATGVNGNQTDNSALGSGAAYVFVRNGTNWTQQAYLKASNTEQFDAFGRRVAISGDTVVIGASGEDSNATGINGNQSDNSASFSGAAYVFARNGTNWTQQAYLKASDTAANDLFGQAVAVSGDTVVVGAENNSSIAANSGAVYVFVRNGTNWTQQARLKASNAGADDQFGDRVAASGDTIVVGAPFESSSATGINGDQSDNAATNAGAAYVFVRNAESWVQQAYLKASNTGVGDFFGGQVAISGDMVVIGAGFEDSDAIGINGDQADNSSTNSGAAYVFVRSGTNWTQQYYLKASNTDPDDRFGVGVAVSGTTVIAGASAEDSAATGVNGDESDNVVFGSGAAYVFDLSLLTPPMLNIAPSGVSQVTLSWTPPTPGFALQESLSLSPVSWSNSPSGETNPITLPASGSTKFFRLFKP